MKYCVLFAIFEKAVKDIKNLAIIVVPLIMTLPRGHTGQNKRIVMMKWL